MKYVVRFKVWLIDKPGFIYRLYFPTIIIGIIALLDYENALTRILKIHTHIGLINNSSDLILFWTFLVIILYTIETYRLRDESYRLTETTIKQNHITEMPILQVTSMERKPRPEDPAFKLKNPDANFYYEIKFKNFRGGLAFVTDIKLWNNIEQNTNPIEVIKYATPQTIFPDHEIPLYFYNEPANDPTKWPEKIEITYTDRYGNNIIYVANKSMRLAQPTPWLGVTPYIQHTFKFPPQLT